MSKNFIYMGFVTGTIFLIGGVIMIARPDIIDLGRYGEYRMIIAGVVIAYALFRVYRSYIALKKQNENL